VVVVVVVPPERADAAADILQDSGEQVSRIGVIANGSGRVQTGA